jgi:hypothetical protein
MQEIIVAFLFIGALVYLARVFRNDFRPTKKGCAKGCGACGQAEVLKMEEIKSK